MADWTSIPDVTFDPDRPVLGSTHLAIVKNFEALAEGAASAPRVQTNALEANSTLNATARDTTAGAVGTYAFARRTTGTGDVSFGATLAGSNLSPTGAASIVGPGLGGTNAAVLGTGAALAGTWRALGFYDHTVTSANDDSGNNQTVVGATLWLRIS
jgi:hypothetical protein